MRLIDADALLQRAVSHGWSTPKWVSDIVIDDAPTIEAAPMKHGRWVYEGHTGEPSEPFYSCSVCQYVNYKASNYCPNCGADMREVEE